MCLRHCVFLHTALPSSLMSYPALPQAEVLRWVDKPTLLSRPEPRLSVALLLHDGAQERGSSGSTSGVLPSSDIGGREPGWG